MSLDKFQTYLSKNKIDACVFRSDDVNAFYFLKEAIGESYILIPNVGKPIIFTSLLEDISLPCTIVSSKTPLKLLKESLTKFKTIGLNFPFVPASFKIKLDKITSTVDVSDILSKLRLTKSSDEIKNIIHACKLSEKVLKEIIKNFKSLNFKYEDDIRKYIKKRAIDLDCEISFEPIVASGINASKPHYASNSKIKDGFLVIDMGLKYKGYCADITRTFYIGKPSDQERKTYRFLLSIQKKAIALVKSNVKVTDLETFVRKELGIIDKFFIHSLGHGLGLDVHESPRVSLKSKEILKAGMVITIEPGIYSSFGIRFEDDVLVTKTGHKILTSFPKKLIIIPKL